MSHSWTEWTDDDVKVIVMVTLRWSVVAQLGEHLPG
jgi:hypothetical protein